MPQEHRGLCSRVWWMLWSIFPLRPQNWRLMSYGLVVAGTVNGVPQVGFFRTGDPSTFGSTSSRQRSRKLCCHIWKLHVITSSVHLAIWYFCKSLILVPRSSLFQFMWWNNITAEFILQLYWWVESWCTIWNWMTAWPKGISELTVLSYEMRLWVYQPNF